ncbi:MAG TPA: hypothetical protein VJ890_18605 [Vineibacter sp.]|nr:hypothetical protein [Vineibacter sp.]
MPDAANRIRRFIARQPAGLLMLLASACMLIAAVGAVWAKESAPTSSSVEPHRMAAGTTAAFVGRSPQTRSVDLVDCDPPDADPGLARNTNRDARPGRPSGQEEGTK